MYLFFLALVTRVVQLTAQKLGQMLLELLLPRLPA